MRIIDAVFQYVWAGWHLFPLHELLDDGRCSCRAKDCGSPGKHPRTVHGVDDATDDPEMVEAWWLKWPTANIGVACGPSGLVVIDVDLHKPEAIDSFRRLTADGRRLAVTISQITGSSGCHYIYEAPPWDLRNTTGRLPGISIALPGIDLRASGGYIVVPPSKTVGDYEWIKSRVKRPAPCPSWLRPPPDPPRRDHGRMTRDGSRHTGAGGVGRLEALANVVRRAPDGQRNATLNWAAYKAREIGDLPEEARLDMLTEAGLASGLTAHEVAATVASGLGLNGRAR